MPQVTCDTLWGVGEHSIQISAPQGLLFEIDSVLKILNKRRTQSINGLINELMTKVFIEQPWLHRSVNNI